MPGKERFVSRLDFAHASYVAGEEDVVHSFFDGIYAELVEWVVEF